MAAAATACPRPMRRRRTTQPATAVGQPTRRLRPQAVAAATAAAVVATAAGVAPSTPAAEPGARGPAGREAPVRERRRLTTDVLAPSPATNRASYGFQG